MALLFIGFGIYFPSLFHAIVRSIHLEKRPCFRVVEARRRTLVGEYSIARWTGSAMFRSGCFCTSGVLLLTLFFTELSSAVSAWNC